MAVTGTDTRDQVDPRMMLGLSWEGIEALRAAKQVAEQICQSGYIPMPSHGPSGYQLQVIERDKDKRDRVTAALAKSGWAPLYAPEGFIVYNRKG